MSATMGDGGGEEAVDIIVFDQNVSEDAVDPDTEIVVSCKQGWTGTLLSDIDPNVAYYLSTDPVWSVDDVYLGEDHSGLDPDDSDDSESATLLITEETTPGYYYVLFIADYLDEIDETNEGNNVVSVPITVNGLGGEVPTVLITSPNEYICFSTGSSIEIEADIVGAITGKEIQYSIDGGETWEFIWGIATADTELDFTWPIPSFDDPVHIKFKVIVSYLGGVVEDECDVPCLITPPLQAFDLNSEADETSHIFWPFDSDWNSQLYWVVSRGHDVEPTHQCLDHYSLDYVKSSAPTSIWDFVRYLLMGYVDPLCDQNMYFPFSGKVLKVNDTLATSGKNLSLSNIYMIIQNTFYYGVFEYPKKSGNWYTGKHESIITKELYGLANKQMKGNVLEKRKSNEFAFTKLMYCGLCDSGIRIYNRYVISIFTCKQMQKWYSYGVKYLLKDIE